MNDIVLSTYPLSSAFRVRLEQTTGNEVDYVSLADLRAGTLAQTVARLRRLNPQRLTLAFEDPQARVLSPILKLLAGVTRARTLAVAWPDSAPRAFTRRSLIAEGWGVTNATAASLWSLAQARRELRRLGPPVTATTTGPSGTALYLNANLWFGVKAGGSVGHISGVVNGLMDAGYAVDFATCGGRLMVDDRAHVIPLTPPATFGLPSELNHFRFSRMVERQLAALLASRRYDFIYQRLSLANYAGMRLSRRFGVPLVIEYNGSEVWVAQNWGTGMRFANLARQAEARTLEAAQVVVTVSDVLRDELAARGIPRDRIVSYPNCISPLMFDPARHSAAAADVLRAGYGISADALVATFVGTFGPWHGADVLARAIRELLTTRMAWLRRHHVHFLFVGDGTGRAGCMEILSDAVAQGHVTFAGLVPQAEAPRYLAASDILLSPHVRNSDGTAFFGSPTKLFEYMAMGKAIVASDLDQVGEVLRQGLRAASLPASAPTSVSPELAVLTTPGSASDINQALTFLVEQPAWRATLGRNARREALAKYTWQHHVAAILERLPTRQTSGARIARAS